MTIKNQTAVTLTIMGGVLKPSASGEYPEKSFNKLDVHSDIGSCIITTEYSERSFRSFGKLKAEEGTEENEDGMKEIIISSAD